MSIYLHVHNMNNIYHCLKLYHSCSDIWRRLFVTSEALTEEEQSSSPVTATATEPLTTGTHISKITTDPILSDAAISARRQFLHDNFKYASSRDYSQTLTHGYVEYHQLNREEDRLHRPNLEIPVGGMYMHLAQ
jgi:hypothetical protein